MNQDADLDSFCGSLGSVEHRKANGGNGAGAGSEANNSNKREWLQPRPLPNGLAPVETFGARFLPEALGPWIDDISNRLQCPPDYVGVTAITALGAVVGRRVGIRPQNKTDWMEVPNQWGCFIGRPGMLKSPAMNEALRPIRHLEAEAAKENEIAQQAYQAGMSAYKLRRHVKVALEKAQLKKTKQANADIDFQIGEEPKEPMLVRYRTNDTSYESLGELLISNPAGILVERDELISLLRHLDRDDQSVARGFFLSGWSGAQPYTFDRIVRGHRHIDAVCISLIGNTQPARIIDYVRRANLGGAGGDGLIQRFGLMVWPDPSPDWRDVDEYPDNVARQRAWKVYERASKLDVPAALALGASKGPYDQVPFFRFEEKAHGIFLDWRTDLERRLRSGEESPALEGHLAKYRKLVPTLALLNHIANNDPGAVSQKSLVRALAFAKYLETAEARARWRLARAASSRSKKRSCRLCHSIAPPYARTPPLGMKLPSLNKVSATAAATYYDTSTADLRVLCSVMVFRSDRRLCRLHLDRLGAPVVVGASAGGRGQLPKRLRCDGLELVERRLRSEAPSGRSGKITGGHGAEVDGRP